MFDICRRIVKNGMSEALFVRTPARISSVKKCLGSGDGDIIPTSVSLLPTRRRPPHDLLGPAAASIPVPARPWQNKASCVIKMAP